MNHRFFTLAEKIATHREDPNKYTVVKISNNWVVFFGGDEYHIGAAPSFRAAIDEVIPSHINVMRGCNG